MQIRLQHSLPSVHEPPRGVHSEVSSAQVPFVQTPPQQSAFAVQRPSDSMQPGLQRSSTPLPVSTGEQTPEQHCVDT